MKNNNSQLSYERQQSMLSTLLPIVDKSWDFIDAMRDEGWSRVLPRLRFEETFGSAAEVAEHRKITIEERKIRVATPNIRYHIGGPPFVSSYLAEARARQSAQCDASMGVDIAHRWKRYVDPCVRRLERLRSLARSMHGIEISMVSSSIIAVLADTRRAATHRFQIGG